MLDEIKNAAKVALAARDAIRDLQRDFSHIGDRLKELKEDIGDRFDRFESRNSSELRELSSKQIELEHRITKLESALESLAAIFRLHEKSIEDYKRKLAVTDAETLPSAGTSSKKRKPKK